MKAKAVNVYRLCCAACDYVIEQDEAEMLVSSADEIDAAGKAAVERFMAEHWKREGAHHAPGYAEWISNGLRVMVMPITTVPEGWPS